MRGSDPHRTRSSRRAPRCRQSSGSARSCAARRRARVQACFRTPERRGVGLRAARRPVRRRLGRAARSETRRRTPREIDATTCDGPAVRTWIPATRCRRGSTARPSIAPGSIATRRARPFARSTRRSARPVGPALRYALDAEKPASNAAPLHRSLAAAVAHPVERGSAGGPGRPPCEHHRARARGRIARQTLRVPTAGRASACRRTTRSDGSARTTSTVPLRGERNLGEAAIAGTERDEAGATAAATVGERAAAGVERDQAGVAELAAEDERRQGHDRSAPEAAVLRPGARPARTARRGCRSRHLRDDRGRARRASPIGTSIPQAALEDGVTTSTV